MIDPGLLREVVEERSNWAHVEPAPIVLLAILLAGLPGGEVLKDAGYKPLANMDWREIDFLARMLMAVETAGDVAQVAQAILQSDC